VMSVFGLLYQTAVSLHPSAYEPEGWGAEAPNSGKTTIFRAKAKFFGQRPAAKNGKNCIY